ncbi:MAG: N-acetylmuramoyl-L-alanine amidase [Pelagibacterales bacterium]|nr:N-acetylmuramoyl-L-alanine amidase [Pelagibacterales bacterium]
MSIKTVLKYSPNFNLKKRKTKEIKFLIFHYTGMKSEKAAIEKLTDIQSQVGANYFIKKNGEIINMVPDHYAAWHAGLSSWKKLKYLNKNSIGIEISNPGHQFGYKNFTKNQINSIKKLSLVLIKKYKIKKNNILGHSDIAPDRKKDPGERFPWQYLYKSRIGIWHNLDKKKLFKLRKKKLSSNESRSFMKSLKIIGYQSNNKFTKNKKKILTFAFQRRFRPELVNGINDKECLLIIQNLIKI